MSKKRSDAAQSSHADTAPAALTRDERAEIIEIEEGEDGGRDPLDCDAPADPVAAQTADMPEVDAQRNGAAKKLESKAERFVRLANRRVPKALKAMGHVANLASRQSYEYTPEQALCVVNALKGMVNDIERAFTGIKDQPSIWSM